MHDASLFEAAGVGLLRDEMLKVALAAKRLGEDPALQVATVRFFGKFFGLNNDYYVFETTLKDDPPAQLDEATDDVPAEIQSGVNSRVYFVCNEPGEAFVRLPEAQPRHIRAARSIRRFLTGNIEAEVSAFPLFPGKEADYLRAQVLLHGATPRRQKFSLADCKNRRSHGALSERPLLLERRGRARKE